MSDKSSIFVRKSTGLVREASFWDSTVFAAGVAAPVGIVLSFSLFYSLALFPGTNLILATVISFALALPIILTAALLAASIPRTGGDYVWASRIISPQVALISNFSWVLCTFVTGAYVAITWANMSIGPSLSILGNIIHNDTITNLGKLATGKGPQIIFGILAVLVVAVIVSSGTKRMFKIQNFCYGIAITGTLITLVIFLFGSHESFINNFNQYAQQYTKVSDSYNYIISTANAAGFPSHAGYSWSATIPTIAIILGVLIWHFESVYLAGEMKGAGKLKRHLSVGITALAWNTIIIIIGILLLYKITGSQFIQDINYLYNYAPAKYPLPVPPYFNFFAGLITNNPVLNIFISITFLFWVIPGVFANMVCPIRSLFAWSFDGILPEKVSEVNEKTRSPLIALVIVTISIILILIWAGNYTSFFTLCSITVLLGFITILGISISGVLFPFRKKDLFKSSPANIKIGNVPLIVISGILSILIIVFMVYLYIAYPSIGVTSWLIAFELLAVVVIGALAIYYIAYFVQKRRGVNINYSYKELPPE